MDNVFLFKEANNILDFLYIRNLRNNNRHFMTENKKFISLINQIVFYINFPKNYKIYVCYLAKSKIRIGYLLIKRKDCDVYITEVVECSYRKKQIGTKMVEFAISKLDSGTAIFAEILNFNRASIALHISCGFKLKRVGEYSSTYVYEKN